ncbi:MAG TPA: conjugal transfer protein TrbL family protein, partial [Candidatus Dormibacteraeota bacterium]|nr:conjugal transfer protein TrbL family protein [Candidatus Dormibacteraeota bacterium]
GGGPFTRNHALVGMYGVTAGIARWAVTLILLYTSARAIFEHGFRPRYTLKLVLPRAMVAAALIQFGLTVVQAAVDLNNSLTRAVWMGRIDSASALSGWAIFTRTTPGGNLLLAFLFAVVGVLLMLIALSSVARNVLLLILTAALPLVAVGFVLPEARGLVDAWRRLFLSTVFCQVAQVMTLRLAMILTLDRGSGFVDAVHGLVAFYLVLRMPSALHAASKAESKVLSFAHHLEHTATKALQGSATPARTSRVRAHPAA